MNTHNVGSNTALDNCQCMLFIEKDSSPTVPSRGSIALRNDNKTINLYAKNIMRQLPRQLTIRLLNMDGTLYGNELSKDDYTITQCEFRTNTIKLTLSKAFAKNVQFRIGDILRISGVENMESDTREFLERNKGHAITDFGEAKTLNEREWCIELFISNTASGSIIPVWGETLQSQEVPISTYGTISNVGGNIMNVSAQNTLTLKVTSKKPLNSSI